jgi:hypothetical protein
LHLRLLFLLWEHIQWEIRPLRRVVERRNEEVATTTTKVPAEVNLFRHPLQPFNSETRPQPRQRRLLHPQVALGRLLRPLVVLGQLLHHQ